MRSTSSAALRDILFEEDRDRLIALTALERMGGIGSSVLAQHYSKTNRSCKHSWTVSYGSPWAEPTYNLSAKLREITMVLGGESDETVAPEMLYRTTIANKAAPIVIDGIWNKADLDPFLAESPRCRFLFTTRDASIASFNSAREHRVDVLDAAQGRELLARWAGLEVAQLPLAANDVLHECGGLPLALSTVGVLLREASPAECADTAECLRDADLAAVEKQLPPDSRVASASSTSASKLRTSRCKRDTGRLAVLAEGMPASLPILQTLWSVDAAEAPRVSRRLVDRSLAQNDAEGRIRPHDLQLDFVRERYGYSRGARIDSRSSSVMCSVSSNANATAFGDRAWAAG